MQPEYIKNGQNIIIPLQGIVIPMGACTLILQDAKTGRIKSIDHIKNLITTVGKAAMASGLRGNETNNKGIITYCALGTSAVAPANADTKLTTELFRKLVSVRSDSSNVATFQTFFGTPDANGTLREAGLFGDAASGTVDSGTLFAKLAINRVKSASDTLTLGWQITIG